VIEETQEVPAIVEDVIKTEEIAVVIDTEPVVQAAPVEVSFNMSA
jgi:hypothetical protein